MVRNMETEIDLGIRQRCVIHVVRSSQPPVCKLRTLRPKKDVSGSNKMRAQTGQPVAALQEPKPSARREGALRKLFPTHANHASLRHKTAEEAEQRQEKYPVIEGLQALTATAICRLEQPSACLACTSLLSLGTQHR